MDKGNVLVIGDAGVGKTTLIKSIIDSDTETKAFGKTGSSAELCIYETDAFRIIDTVNFDSAFLKAHSTMASVQKWMKERTKQGCTDNTINVIWLCLDSSLSSEYDKKVKELLKSLSLWKTVPVITVLTKAYSDEERLSNIDLVINSFSKNKAENSLAGIVPVIAGSDESDDYNDFQLLGLEDLIIETNSIMPEGIKKGEEALQNFKLKRKRTLAQSLIASSVAAGATVGAVPLPFPDAGILTAIEASEVRGISKIYEFKSDKKSRELISYIIDLGTVSVIAKSFIQAIKLIPGLSLVGAPLNAFVAGLIVCAIGESSAFIFEKIYVGDKKSDDLEWIESVVKEKLDKLPVEEISKEIEKCGKKVGINDIVRIIMKFFKYKNKNEKDTAVNLIETKAETV